MTTTPYIPDRGDVIQIDFDPQAGHEQWGRRPGLVLSPADYNGLVGLALVAPFTSKAKGYAYEVVVPVGLPVYGVVLADQTRSMDWRARRAVFVCHISLEVTDDVIAKLRTLLVDDSLP